MARFSEEARVLRDRGYQFVDNGRLGEGTYAKVKCAYSTQLANHVAVKIIDKKRAPSDFINKFLPREMVVIKRLRHKHIIQVLDLFEVREKVYVIMELATRGDLLEYIRYRGCVRERKAKKVFSQLLQAVKYCHQQGVIHRDLKCENVLLDIGDNVKLTDFGFSKLNPRKELCKTFCGSAAYAAIEILQGTEYDGEKADIWSLGIILYTMVTGRMPFDDANMTTLLRQIKRGVEFRKPKQMVSEECRDLIRCMLTHNYEYRITIPEIEAHRWIISDLREGSSSTSEQTIESFKSARSS
ncbi:predicted protein [Nematostella vectensis]|uniref:Protein kinase domain-containing protein n=1 Tax=Nematostella vectensis TaxID=45351 RepID=A7SGS0_NEMVE|nr:predicted protein [Nematostella vectensis]|eukprot:XP_001629206.1 predicted protein [Nematostella vectensis]